MACIVVYRTHGALMCETKFYGPFDSYGAAYGHLETLPPIGFQHTDSDQELPGVKYIDDLIEVKKEGL